MNPHIDYYFVGSSPFTFFGHKAIREVAAKHRATLRYKPVDPLGVWKESGSVPLPQRTDSRKRYRFLELQRIADMRGMEINLKPAFFPVDTVLADSCVIAIDQMGADAGDYMAACLAGVWQDEADMSQEQEVAKRLTLTGFDAAKVIETAQSDTIAEIRANYTADAVADDAMGMPTYVLNGEAFWGQDRIEFLDLALTSGRQPYRPLPLN